MSISTLETTIDETGLEDLFDLDVQIEITETSAEAGFTSFGCSFTCSCSPTLCC
ncbi:FDLD family class I lanthipeptide [Streptomyces sp. NPDC094438]|uniref:FDLD family class I lanthipeptide n=1 Tax=Streptomyces sp. NPDC094438 TaxID=3366061 RepID=UPI00380C0812